MNGFHPLTILASIAGLVIGGAVADTFLQGVGVISASVGLVSIVFTLRAGRRGRRRASEIAYDSAVWGVPLGILILVLDAILG